MCLALSVSMMHAGYEAVKSFFVFRLICKQASGFPALNGRRFVITMCQPWLKRKQPWQHRLKHQSVRSPLWATQDWDKCNNELDVGGKCWKHLNKPLGPFVMLVKKKRKKYWKISYFVGIRKELKFKKNTLKAAGYRNQWWERFNMEI